MRVVAVVRVLVCASGSMLGQDGQAAEVHMRAPDGCVEASAVVEQVDGLLGRPLGSVEGVDFEVEIAEGSHRQWRLRLDTIDRADRRRRTRELSGNSCAELADAAAVTIAMSIKSSESSAVGNRTPEKSTTPPPEEVPSREANLPTVAAQAAAPPPASLRVSVALAVVADAGALPHAGVGLAIEGSLQFRRLRLVGQGALFPSQDTRLPAVGGGTGGGAGGDFQLAVGAALACVTEGLDRLTVLGCGGGEIGRLSGEGVGANIASSSRDALWMAGRAEIGVALPFSPRLAVVLRAGAAVPIRRPTFVLDGNTRVHRPGNVTARASLGVELGF
jgi:hypothetical protein